MRKPVLLTPNFPEYVHHSMIDIGPFRLSGQVFLAPMAGITDSPFRRMCRGQGAALTTSEMLTSDTRLWNSRKSHSRLLFDESETIRSVQIVGSNPDQLVEAAKSSVDYGAQLVDINMGCPAKKVCNVAAGSALLRNEALVTDILHSVVNAVDVPVTLKIRTGWDAENRNAVNIARIAESEGIRLLAIHGRTRACKFGGEAEYETIANVKQAVGIPVIANGDIDSPQKAAQVIRTTGVDGVMVGRGVQGRPWLIDQIQSYLDSGEFKPEPELQEKVAIIGDHLDALYSFYDEYTAVRMARKHLVWYGGYFPGFTQVRSRLMKAETPVEQKNIIIDFLNNAGVRGGQAA